MTKLEAIRELQQYDHCFLSPEGVKAMGEPFGVSLATRLEKDNRHTPKGLRLNGGMTEAEGLGAHILAERICMKENVAYPVLYGRGSQLQVCCQLIEAKLLKAKGEA